MDPSQPAEAAAGAAGAVTAASQPHTVEYIVIGLFFVFMIAIGLVSRRMVRNFSDYFRSGSKATWWLVGLSGFMASFSAWTFTGAASTAYESGITVAVIFLAGVVGIAICALFTAPWFRQLRAITVPEVVDDRFGTATQQLYLWLSIIPMIGWSVPGFLAVAVFTSVVFGFKVGTVILGLGVVVLAYSTIGGSWSVLTTDFLQALLLMPLALLIAILSLKSIGGFEGLYHSLLEQGLHNHLRLVDPVPDSKYGIYWAVAMLVFQVFTYNSLTSSNRFFWCKDGRDARKAAWFTAGLFMIGALIWFLPPIVARLQFSQQVMAYTDLSNPADAAYAVTALRLLPAGLAGLIVVAMFSATMSSMDFTLNQAAAVITQDFYKKILNPHASDRRTLIVGQIASFCLGSVIIALALYLSTRKDLGLFDIMLKVGSLLSTPFLVPMLLVLFVRKSPPWSAAVSILAGVALSYLAFHFGWKYHVTVFSIIAAGGVSYLATLPFWESSSEVYKRKVAAFYQKMERPVDFEKEVGGAIDTRQMRMLGWFSFAIGGFIALLVFLPNPASGRIQILCLSGGIGGLGAVMLWAAGYFDRRNAARLAAAQPTATSTAPPAAPAASSSSEQNANTKS